jgi:hypothetical protein
VAAHKFTPANDFRSLTALLRNFDSVPAFNAEARSQAAHEKTGAGLIDLSEKQYQAPGGLARNCRFFLISRPGTQSALSLPFGNAERSHQPNPI